MTPKSSNGCHLRNRAKKQEGDEQDSVHRFSLGPCLDARALFAQQARSQKESSTGKNRRAAAKKEEAKKEEPGMRGMKLIKTAAKDEEDGS